MIVSPTGSPPATATCAPAPRRAANRDLRNCRFAAIGPSIGGYNGVHIFGPGGELKDVGAVAMKHDKDAPSIIH